MEQFVGILFVLFIFLPIIFLLNSLHRSKMRALLNKWASENKYRIEECAVRSRSESPFSAWGAHKGDIIFRVAFSDSNGQIRKAWARCRTSSLFRPERVEVKWDDAPITK